MTRRENRRGRARPFREERRRILIVCGGEVTEPAYFNGLKKARRNPAVNVKILDKGVDPRKLVRYASLQCGETGDYDETWCVVDVDEFDLNEAISLARAQEIGLAISNPCFEYWLLLHFESCAAPLASFCDVEGRLLKHVPKYSKTTLRFEDFAAGVDDAIERAQAGCPEQGREHKHNPSTRVWELVRAIT